MKINKIYYVKFENENEVVYLEVVAKCIDDENHSTSLRPINIMKREGFYKGDIQCNNYEECEKYNNGNGILVTVKELTKEKNPEYFL